MNAPVAATEDLIYSVEDGIARLTFNRPQARNALTFAMYEQMAVICETVNADRSIKAMILTGAGDKAFASGTDISQFRAFKTAQDALDYEARIDRVLGALEACRVPTIAAIAGACTGVGVGILFSGLIFLLQAERKLSSSNEPIGESRERIEYYLAQIRKHPSQPVKSVDPEVK